MAHIYSHRGKKISLTLSPNDIGVRFETPDVAADAFRSVRSRIDAERLCLGYIHDNRMTANRILVEADRQRDGVASAEAPCVLVHLHDDDRRAGLVLQI